MVEKHRKTQQYSGKIIPKLLRYLGKIDFVHQTDDWVEKTRALILNWITEYLIINPILIFMCLLFVKYSFHLTYPQVSLILAAEGT